MKVELSESKVRGMIYSVVLQLQHRFELARERYFDKISSLEDSNDNMFRRIRELEEKVSNLERYK